MHDLNARGFDTQGDFQSAKRELRDRYDGIAAAGSLPGLFGERARNSGESNLRSLRTDSWKVATVRRRAVHPLIESREINPREQDRAADGGWRWGEFLV